MSRKLFDDVLSVIMSIYLTNFLNLMVKYIVLVVCTPETYPMYLKVVNINYAKVWRTRIREDSDLTYGKNAPVLKAPTGNLPLKLTGKKAPEKYHDCKMIGFLFFFCLCSMAFYC